MSTKHGFTTLKRRYARNTVLAELALVGLDSEYDRVAALVPESPTRTPFTFRLDIIDAELDRHNRWLQALPAELPRLDYNLPIASLAMLLEALHRLDALLSRLEAQLPAVPAQRILQEVR